MLLIMMSHWDTTSKGEHEDLINKLVEKKKKSPIEYLFYVFVFLFSFPTIYFAPVGKKDNPIRYQVTQLDAF